MALKAAVGAVISDALSIVHVAILGCAAWAGRVGRILHVDEDKASAARVVTRLSANSDSVVLVLVDDQVVAATPRKAVIEASQVFGRGEVLGARRVDVKEFGHVEDLNTRTNGFRADEHVVFVGLHVTPDGSDTLLRKSAKVDKLSLLGDLHESSAIGLTQCNKLSSIRGYPTPCIIALTGPRFKVSMALEVVEVDVVA